MHASLRSCFPLALLALAACSPEGGQEAARPATTAAAVQREQEPECTTSAGSQSRDTAGAEHFTPTPTEACTHARRGDAIVFRKDDQTNPRAGESIKSGDLRCGRRSG